MDSASAREPFERVFMDGQTLVVELVSDTVVDRVNVIAPDGSEFASQPVATGASRVEIEIGVSYTPGAYRIVGAADGEASAELTFNLSPELRITGLGIGKNHPEMIPEGLDATGNSEIWVKVENRGNGPAAIEKLLILGGVPNPTTEIESAPESEAVSGIFDQEFGAGDVDRVELSGETDTILFSNTQPFSFSTTDSECPEEPTSEQFEVVLRARPGASASKQYTAEYRPDSGDCVAMIQTLD